MKTPTLSYRLVLVAVVFCILQLAITTKAHNPMEMAPGGGQIGPMGGIQMGGSQMGGGPMGGGAMGGGPMGASQMGGGAMGGSQMGGGAMGGGQMGSNPMDVAIDGARKMASVPFQVGGEAAQVGQNIVAGGRP